MYHEHFNDDLRLSVRLSHCDKALMTSYLRSIVTMALFRVVSEILIVEKCRDFEMWVKSHSRSLAAVSFDRLCIIFLLVFFSNFNH